MSETVPPSGDRLSPDEIRPVCLPQTRHPNRERLYRVRAHARHQCCELPTLQHDAYGLAIKEEDLPVDGNTQIANRIERVLQEKHGHSELDKRHVMKTMLKEFESWQTIKDLPNGVAPKVEKLFRRINKEFAKNDENEDAEPAKTN